MKTVILCGGQGLRIRDVSEILPKPMIKIGNLPILHHIMNLYSKYNHNNFILCVGYKSDVILDDFKNLPYNLSDVHFNFKNKSETIKLDKTISNWTVQIAHTGTDSLTGKRVKMIEKYIKEKDFFLTYGDGIGNIDISKLLKFHKSHNKIATLTAVRPQSRFGEIKVENKFVKVFSEKTQLGIGRINGGFFVCKKKIFDYFDNEDSNCSFEHNILPKLSADSQLMSFDHKDFWMPMDTNREYIKLNNIWKKNPKKFY